MDGLENKQKRGSESLYSILIMQGAAAATGLGDAVRGEAEPFLSIRGRFAILRVAPFAFRDLGFSRPPVGYWWVGGGGDLD